MRRLIKILKYTFALFAALILLLLGSLTYLYQTADMVKPTASVNLDDYKVTTDSGYLACNDNFLRKNNSGLYEVYLHGDPLNRGVALGKLTKDLLYHQEKCFIDQINVIVPSKSYLKFLRYLTVIFNRNIGQFVPEEYRNEIYGISFSCSNEFDAIGPAYERQLNFHAAHDIGHAMQEYMLVGCSSFGVWGDKSEDSTLLIGRNFDFFVGDDFAKNKLISFVAPTKGYKYASVGWAGMVGVLSGMNETGLTVTLNAAKGDIPTASATPISILAREILQYASTIDEAYQIAQKHQTFVSESLLIGSAKDGKAAIIEKTPSQIALFTSPNNQIICTNHYQSDLYKNNKKNIENIETSDSPYRFNRINELISLKSPLSPQKAADILRTQTGINDLNIGLTNEKSINQSIAHHSVIFKPQQKQMWVSTSPWQSGKYICYDLNQIFTNQNFSSELNIDSLSIAADSTYIKQDYNNILKYRSLTKQITRAIKQSQELSGDELNEIIRVNPNYFYAYQMVGDYYYQFNKPSLSIQFWESALTKEIPRSNEKTSIEKKIKTLKNE